MESPLVSVVIPVHNAMPYLLKSLQSVVDQTIGIERLEVIAVDDGSTDGGGDVLDDFAKRYPTVFRVFHQEASGTPSIPRNRALDIARGKYVFLLDADDYLGDEALERMVAMAEENDSDVVLGKLVGVNGRPVAMSMFQRDQPKADLYESRVYWALGPLKLYRRELLEQHAIRFPINRRTGEDRHFVALTFYHARTISVVAGYDCVYTVIREDGGNLSQGGMRLPKDRTFNRDSQLRYMIEVIGDLVPEGPKQDFLMYRHWEVEGDVDLHHLLREATREDQQAHLESLQELVAKWYRPGSAHHLRPDLRLSYRLIEMGDLDGLLSLLTHRHQNGVPGTVSFVGRGDKVWAVLPGHEAEAGNGEGPWVDITDAVAINHWLDEVQAAGRSLQVRGTGRLKWVPHDRLTLHLELHRRGTDERRRVAIEHENGIFTVDLDLDRLLGRMRRAVGDWDFTICVAIDEKEYRAPYGTRHGGPLVRKPIPKLLWRDARYPRRAFAALGAGKQGVLSLRVLDRSLKATAAKLVRRLRR
ncbi:glycosyltransferase family 2 protein [Glycomyces tritici]|uniref:Glycosyltransferase n=1 Tax=Glycomyces tritici TaxID=2665176 RepID=A0ABT7YP96_9ACTN|nr:glycosyltransferase [Glycomyces tritici]MDN3240421.1 glycosyltransferase [Glycomyces tritici]